MQAVNMQEPPKLDKKAFAEVLRQTKDHVGWGNYDGVVHIKNTAKQYADFFERVLNV